MNELPCKDCITLAICRSQTEGTSWEIILRLVKKCSMLSNYLHLKGDSVIITARQGGKKHKQEFTIKKMNTLIDFMEWD